MPCARPWIPAWSFPDRATGLRPRVRRRREREYRQRARTAQYPGEFAGLTERRQESAERRVTAAHRAIENALSGTFGYESRDCCARSGDDSEAVGVPGRFLRYDIRVWQGMLIGEAESTSDA